MPTEQVLAEMQVELDRSCNESIFFRVPPTVHFDPRWGGQDAEQELVAAVQRCVDERIAAMATTTTPPTTIAPVTTPPTAPPPPPEGPPERLVYSWESPPVECCDQSRVEETGTFSVSGNWRIKWGSINNGLNCAVTGTIKQNGVDAGLVSFGPAGGGDRSYNSTGTYSISLREECPDPDSIMKVIIKVYD